jgi:DNA-binding response OmpR family regulator
VVKGATVKILVVDDEAVSRRLLQSYLQKWGHEVVVAQDGAEAWRLFQDGEYPIVITDWLMPELDGVDLIRKIRSHSERGYIYTILLSAKSKKEDLVEGMEAGADDFLTKPFDRDELRVRLREGERIINLERTLAEQNRTLREAQSALLTRDRLARLQQSVVGTSADLKERLSEIARDLTELASTTSTLAPLAPNLPGRLSALIRDVERAVELSGRMRDMAQEDGAELAD